MQVGSRVKSILDAMSLMCVGWLGYHRKLHIMLPVEPYCLLDKRLSGSTHPEGDETAPHDGWAAFSGTSAAAPQIAGVCALMKQVWPDVTPATARTILKKTARDITCGHCAQGHPAGPGPDLATGHGLVDLSSSRTHMAHEDTRYPSV